MRTSLLTLFSLLTLSAALTAGCLGQSTGLAGDPTGTGTGTGTGGGGGNSVGGGGSGSTELPCEAYNLLSASCWSCHGATPAGGAPQSLVTLAELQAMSPGYPTQSNGARAVVRMASTTSPMPPGGSVPTAEQTAFAAWVTANMPTGTCASGTLPDGGTGGTPDPLNAAATCTSGQTVTGSEGSSMRPGEACIACHQSHGANTYDVMGTVYPTGHEPDDCSAASAAGAVVTVVDAAGHQSSFTANNVGNFHGDGTPSMTFPIGVSVSFNGKTRAMAGKAPNGDCNSCHTPTGANSAPGRVTLPP